MTEHQIADLTHFQTELMTQLNEQKNRIIAFLEQAEQPSHRMAAARLMQLTNAEFIEYAIHLDEPKFKPAIAMIKRIDAALCQIDLGLYGLCSDCEEPIEMALLSQDPTEQRCFRCKEKYQKRKTGVIAL
ncbi:TraR/DksA family transcriptional regulator [Motilimonas sp. KMU-193]|uniref:TraR/DksA family transcriptional regulator n=1 Tax=Motilimonas sp. KMU-193 TaxID=3388668 RepID=UPI00396B1961